MTKAELIETVARATQLEKKTAARSHRAYLRPHRARDSQGQALLGARLRHLLSAPPPRASGLQPAHAESDDDSGRAHDRFSPRTAAQKGAVAKRGCRTSRARAAGAIALPPDS